MVILKIQHREDIRRITLENPKFSTLKELLGQIFPNLNASYSIKWKDDENDLITVTSDIELREAVESNPTTILRLFITEDSPPSIVKRDAATAPQATEGPIHPNVICDGCNNGVVGTRYKCLVCHDFDLCEPCESQKSHDPSHPMLKIQQPIQDSLGLTQSIPMPNRRSTPTSNPWKPTLRPFCHRQKKLRFDWLPHEDLKPTEASEPKEVETPLQSSRGWGNSQGWSNTAPWKQNPAPAIRINHLARFVSDVTIPDGTSMEPNQKFVKTWRIRNEGQYNWPCGSQLAWVGGDLLGASEFIDVPEIATGEEFDVSVDMISPTRPGRYVGYWRMLHDGQRFGQRLWVDIIVCTSEPKIEPVVPSEIPEVTTPLVDATSPEMEEICRRLADMGFTDRSKNIQLLKEHSNSLVEVLTVLLQ